MSMMVADLSFGRPYPWPHSHLGTCNTFAHNYVMINTTISVFKLQRINDSKNVCANFDHAILHGPLTRYLKLWFVQAPGKFSPPSTSKEIPGRKPLVSDPGMHHGTCVTHVSWCMLGSLIRGGGQNVPGACATHKFTYLVRGPWPGNYRLKYQIYIWSVSCI